MPLVVVVAVFVVFFNWHDHEKIIQCDHDKILMACRGRGKGSRQTLYSK